MIYVCNWKSWFWTIWCRSEITISNFHSGSRKTTGAFKDIITIILNVCLPTGQSGHVDGQPERANWAEVHDVLVKRRTALHHMVQGRQSDGGQGAEGRPEARFGQSSRLRHVSVSGAQGRRGDGTERGHRTLGWWVNQFTVFLVARDCFWKKKTYPRQSQYTEK